MKILIPLIALLLGCAFLIMITSDSGHIAVQESRITEDSLNNDLLDSGAIMDNLEDGSKANGMQRAKWSEASESEGKPQEDSSVSLVIEGCLWAGGGHPGPGAIHGILLSTDWAHPIKISASFKDSSQRLEVDLPIEDQKDIPTIIEYTFRYFSNSGLHGLASGSVTPPGYSGEINLGLLMIYPGDSGFSGMVVDDNGRPIQGCLVRTFSQGGSQSLDSFFGDEMDTEFQPFSATISDENGRFMLLSSRAQERKVLIMAHCPGFQDFHDVVSVDHENEMTIKLSRDKIYLVNVVYPDGISEEYFKILSFDANGRHVLSIPNSIPTPLHYVGDSFELRILAINGEIFVTREVHLDDEGDAPPGPNLIELSSLSRVVHLNFRPSLADYVGQVSLQVYPAIRGNGDSLADGKSIAINESFTGLPIPLDSLGIDFDLLTSFGDTLEYRGIAGDIDVTLPATPKLTINVSGWEEEANQSKLACVLQITPSNSTEVFEDVALVPSSGKVEFNPPVMGEMVVVLASIDEGDEPKQLAVFHGDLLPGEKIKKVTLGKEK